MKESLIALEHFITDFNLRQSSGVIAFTASIQFNAGGQTKTEESEVHIITSDNIGAIYFLSLDGKAVPDMFSARDQKFTYTVGRSLNIEAGNITASVFPKTKDTGQI